MKKYTLIASLLLIIYTALGQTRQGGYPITPVSFTSVRVTDEFWGQRLNASREVTIPLAFRKSKETGRYENFVKAANPSTDYQVGGFSFDDTDVYKTIEGASYSMQNYPDRQLDLYIDSVLKIVAAAQEDDGYLYTARTMNPEHPHEWAGNERWEQVEVLSHEFYNLGHMIEGAIAHYQATGKRNFLDIAIRYADCVEREIGEGAGKQVKVPGHQIAEMALAKLYLVTGQQKYLDLAKFFLDKRGYTARKDAYSQAHKPVIEQDEAVGHAVRAAYMYAGMADIAALTGDSAYVQAIDKIWENVVSKKLYITGGIGAKHEGEAFGGNYELPNASAYNETCAAIANVYWNHRLFLLHGDSKYYDVLERTLYNGLIAGVAVDGGTFFYPNPLESDGKYAFNQGACHRQDWFGCACCPSNLSRFMPSLPGYIYAIKENEVYVNLFMDNLAELDLGEKKVKLKQTTDYPWNGNVKIEIEPESEQEISLRLRIPGWARNEVVPSDLYTFADQHETDDYVVKVNGKPVESRLESGYFSINRTWKKGDQIELILNMSPRMVKAHEQVEADLGKISFERGPIVYCAEWPDNDFNFHKVNIPADPQVRAVYNQKLLNGMMQLEAQALSGSVSKTGSIREDKVKLTLIPYYAWAHRGDGDMAVWIKTAY